MDEDQTGKALFGILQYWCLCWDDFRYTVHDTGLIALIAITFKIFLFSEGLEVIDDLLTPPQKKLGFVCIWFSFAFALFLLNRSFTKM